jgi:hypothetical protein
MLHFCNFEISGVMAFLFFPKRNINSSLWLVARFQVCEMNENLKSIFTLSRICSLQIIIEFLSWKRSFCIANEFLVEFYLFPQTYTIGNSFPPWKSKIQDSVYWEAAVLHVLTIMRSFWCKNVAHGFGIIEMIHPPTGWPQTADVSVRQKSW